MMHLNLDDTKKRSLTKQIYTEIRRKILFGELEAGQCLPSSRDLSRELCVARNTVLTAYDMLVSEGAVYSVGGSGFFVSSDVTCEPRSILLEDQQTASLADIVVTDRTISFDSGTPAVDLFPRRRWNRAVSEAFLDAPVSALGYDDPQGRPEFRTVLSIYLKKTRGISCRPEQIIITSGTKQGLSLIAKCLLNANAEVWLENPSNANVLKIFSYHTNRLIPFEVDEQGVRPELFPAKGTPTLILTTPAHQFPMGGILPMKRRGELIQFARTSGAYLLEDDYDSEFTYDAPPSNSLFELDCEHVIFTGTFSKVLFPSVRLGYLVVPMQLVPKMRELKRLSDHHSNSIYQLALMRFIESGELERHIRRMKKEYRQRRDTLLQLLTSRFGDQVRVYGTAAGMHVVAEFASVAFTEERIRRLYQAGVYVVPVENHSLIKGNHTNQLILGYAGLSAETMARGIDRIQAELSGS